MNLFDIRKKILIDEHNKLVDRENEVECTNGVWTRYRNPVLTAAHVPLNWRYDLNPATNPGLAERVGINAVFNAGAIMLDGKFTLVARVEAADRKSFFAVASSDKGTEGFRFTGRPILLPQTDDPDTNVYDMRLTRHEDGWIYGVFCSERKDLRHPEDLSAAVASAGIVRTHDLVDWERLPDLKCDSQQRNVVLHPEFVNGQYALYTRPQDDFINTGSGGGIGWALVPDITDARVDRQTIIEERHYHTIKELKNGEGPAPIKTPQGWLHLAHGVRGCAAGLRYVLYLYMTAIDDPTRVIAQPAGYFMAPMGEERVGDVSNVLFSNGWIEDNGIVYIYYASSDTRLHVATSTVDALVDYCMNTKPDGFRSSETVNVINQLIDRNNEFI